MSTMARRLDEVIDDHLEAVRRLADEDTWTGPHARALQEDLRGLRLGLQRLAEDWHALERRLSQP